MSFTTLAIGSPFAPPVCDTALRYSVRGKDEYLALLLRWQDAEECQVRPDSTTASLALGEGADTGKARLVLNDASEHSRTWRKKNKRAISLRLPWKTCERLQELFPKASLYALAVIEATPEHILFWLPGHEPEPKPVPEPAPPPSPKVKAVPGTVFDHSRYASIAANCRKVFDFKGGPTTSAWFRKVCKATKLDPASFKTPEAAAAALVTALMAQDAD